MILILNLNEHKLAYHEYITPIINALKDTNYKVIHYKEKFNPDDYEKIIIAGTPIHDNNFIANITKFEWIENYKKPILGICAGAEILALVFKSKLINKTEIGMTKITTIKENKLFEGEFEAYSLHSLTPELSNHFETLANQAFKHKDKPFYGLMFHPEVRNKNILKKFIL